MEQAIATTAQKMIDKPQDAWMATLPILFILLVLGVVFFAYKLWQKSSEQSEVREQRLTNIIDTTIKEHGQTIAKQTEVLADMSKTLNKVEDRVDDIEEKLGIRGGTPS